MEPIISPSLLSANFRHLGREIMSVRSADWLHVDVMDGHFVPNISYGYPIVDTLVASSDPHPLDIHLMISNPLDHVERFALSLPPEHGGQVSFHYEACDEETIAKCLDVLEQYPWVRKGLAIKPHTDPDVLVPWLSRLDTVLVMTVEPGRGGQSFLSHRLEGLARVHGLIDQYRPECRLEVDGGIDIQTIARCAKVGADVFVAGTYIFHRDNRSQAIAELRGACHV